MEAYVAENWPWDDEEIDAIWEWLHGPQTKDPIVEISNYLTTLPQGSNQWAIPLRIFARAYDNDEEKLMESIYSSSLIHRSHQYRLLSHIRDDGNWSLYEKLLRVLKPRPGDLGSALRGSSDSLSGLQIFLENAEPTQNELTTGVRDIFLDATDDSDVARLNVLLPLITGDKSWLNDYVQQMVDSGWSRHATALVAHGATMIPPGLARTLMEGPAWPLLRARQVWPDLPYRVILWLQGLENGYRPSVEAAVGHNLSRYIMRAI